MKDKITQVVEEQHGENDTIFKEDLITQLKKSISDEIQDVQIKLIDPSKTQQYIDGVNDFMIKLKHGLVGE